VIDWLGAHPGLVLLVVILAPLVLRLLFGLPALPLPDDCRSVLVFPC
jgi:hypothetical protein